MISAFQWSLLKAWRWTQRLAAGFQQQGQEGDWCTATRGFANIHICNSATDVYHCMIHCMGEWCWQLVCYTVYVYVYIYMILLDVPNFLHYLAYKRINYLPTGMDVAVPLQTQKPYRIEKPIESYLPIFSRVRCKHGNPSEQKSGSVAILGFYRQK